MDASSTNRVQVASDGQVSALGGHGHASYLTQHDERWNDCPYVVELVSAAWDPDFLGIGSSPYEGDVGYTGIRVPAQPTVDQAHRYLYRLVGIEIPGGRMIVVRGVRQYVSLRTPGIAPPAGVQVPLEFDVESPFWHFIDGNVSWHLRWEANLQTRLNVFDRNQLPGTSPSLAGLDSALLYVPPLFPPVHFGPDYVPPGAGIPPGKNVFQLGTWHDLRYPWTNTDWDMSLPIHGPGRLVFYASVHQTNSATRPAIAVPPAGIGVLRPEDQFVSAFESAETPVFYGRVAGALSVELFPCCGYAGPRARCDVDLMK